MCAAVLDNDITGVEENKPRTSPVITSQFTTLGPPNFDLGSEDLDDANDGDVGDMEVLEEEVGCPLLRKSYLKARLGRYQGGVCGGRRPDKYKSVGSINQLRKDHLEMRSVLQSMNKAPGTPAKKKKPLMRCRAVTPHPKSKRKDPGDKGSVYQEEGGGWVYAMHPSLALDIDIVLSMKKLGLHRPHANKYTSSVRLAVNFQRVRSKLRTQQTSIPKPLFLLDENSVPEVLSPNTMGTDALPSHDEGATVDSIFFPTLSDKNIIADHTSANNNCSPIISPRTSANSSKNCSPKKPSSAENWLAPPGLEKSVVVSCEDLYLQSCQGSLCRIPP
jgi:hypothetical protein